MTVKKETLLVQKCIAWVKVNGGDAWHVHGSSVQRAGEPDIDGWMRYAGGVKHFKIEIKVDDGQPSAIQLKRLLVYDNAGYVTGVAWTYEQFKDIVEKGVMLAWQTQPMSKS